MDLGAQKAEGRILLFLHADTYVEKGALQSIREEIDVGFVGGCMCQRIDEKGWIYRWIELTGNLKAKCFNSFYGDQGIFVRKDIFFS